MIPKFRAWDKLTKTMISVEAISYTEEVIYPFNGKVIKRFVPFKDIVLMQSTGLKDKSGVEIFDGDVVAYFDGDEQISENVIIRYGKHTDEASVLEEKPKHIGFYVEVTEETATFDVIDMYEDFKEDIKVIGNIYENPELLEE